QPIDVYNNGNHKRDFTYIEDVVESVVRVIEHLPQPDETWSGERPNPATSTAPYRLYNVGNSRPVELLYLIELLEEAIGKKARKTMLPLQPGDIPETFAEVESLAQAVGFRPRVPIEQGIRRFLAWYI